ncbi:MAG: SOS response-associated peptidase family protein [Alphaproteobacteria bacterium]|nr:SOS response-associated peptidase family protein [Alphaproteobacteria bacterium]
MCNLYRLRLAAWEVRNLMEHRKLIGTNFPPTEVFPDGTASVIVSLPDGNRVVREMRWGFPEFPGERGVRTNVRHPKSEPWRGKFEVASRCVVPVDAFCEYQDGPSPKAKRWFARPDGAPFFFAGTWTTWEGSRGPKKAPVVGTHELFTILTTAPNKIVKPVHGKAMPVVLMSPEDVETWLTAATNEALNLQRPAPDDALVILPDEVKAA